MFWLINVLNSDIFHMFNVMIVRSFVRMRSDVCIPIFVVAPLRCVEPLDELKRGVRLLGGQHKVTPGRQWYRGVSA